jgi:hypothetical protein
MARNERCARITEQNRQRKRKYDEKKSQQKQQSGNVTEDEAVESAEQRKAQYADAGRLPFRRARRAMTCGEFRTSKPGRTRRKPANPPIAISRRTLPPAAT